MLSYDYTEATVDANLNEVGVGVATVFLSIPRIARPRRSRIVVLAVLTMTLVAGCGGEDETLRDLPLPGTDATTASLRFDGLRLEQPVEEGLDALPAGSDIPLYGQVVNPGSNPDTLLGVQSSIAMNTLMVGPEGDVPHEDLEVPARGVLALNPSGPYVVVLGGLTRNLPVGETVSVTFQFGKTGDVTVDVLVETPS